MAREVDLSKPLDEDTIAWLRSTRPLGTVEHLIRVAEQNGSASADDPDDGGGDELFDPSEHDAREVKDYLLTASEEEAARVIEAERAGKARVGILKDA